MLHEKLKSTAFVGYCVVMPMPQKLLRAPEFACVDSVRRALRYNGLRLVVMWS